MAYLYYFNGQYQTYDYMHDNYGYTYEPSQYTQYKSVDNWGELDGDGYYSGVQTTVQILNASFWKSNHVGWMSANGLALYGRGYPAIAQDDISCIHGEQVSKAAKIETDTFDYYLIQDAVELGWLTEAMMAEHGWIIAQMSDYVILDGTDYSELKRGFYKISTLDVPVKVISSSGVYIWCRVWIFNEIFEPKPSFFSKQLVFNQKSITPLTMVKTLVFNEVQQPEIDYVDIT